MRPRVDSVLLLTLLSACHQTPSAPPLSLHAATTASAGDDAGKEALCRYILRPPIAAGRIQLLGDDLVRLEL